MKNELKAKFLQHLLGKKKDGEGFTLIELLVVIIIIGILSAIALPSFLSQANKGKQAEAKQNVATVNKSLQAYAIENSDWVTAIADIGKLGTGIRTATVNYTYGMYAIDTTNKGGAGLIATGATGLLHYQGAVANVYQAGGDLPAALSIICQSATTTDKPTAAGDFDYTLGNKTTGGTFACKAPFEALSK
ncbi:prepilin-type N-terminal cleavage/methylation domain-containing protein [Cuspidothrix issatschenkoi LEGE 03284]|uniref:type IV pilin-like G/H family protein n=1 Tax=Cuspidothrix issatschenkoi TaxID=230752 RepID=UPI001882460A|nr:type IV pilin-like G/H family protein [Cuspidothrix issatschenkoi]MBE9234168.1 prepilin-type N-terminal cleavage/methylation domain-containing protein [Cuspidothrix issatschenkoi LEGE 03284]